MTTCPRPEYPRPQFVRSDWLNLNGPWEFDFDDDLQGLAAGWNLPAHHLSREIIVPFPFEARASGIGDTSVHRLVWYRREFVVPEEWKDRRVRLHFGAVDYEATVWINGRLVGFHRGGYVAFWFDITDALHSGVNVLTLRIFDDLVPDQPRGKQGLTIASHGIWYTRCTGIWRTVWLEPVSETYIQDWDVQPDFERGEVEVSVRVTGAQTLELQVEASIQGSPAGEGSGPLAGGKGRIRFTLEPFRTWSPDDPHLYDLTLTLREEGKITDQAVTYFGVREVGVRDGFITLNRQQFYQKLVLDQSYWPEGIYTAPNDEAIRSDVEWVKRLGFNGVRKHQVSSDPRFLYWADRLGIVVWADMPGQTISRRDAPKVRATGQAESNFLREWTALIRESRNHPSIIVWVPFNETWGIYGVSEDAATQAFLKDVMDLTQALDPTRLMVDNDGWEHSELTDVYSLHYYTREGEDPLRAILENWRQLAMGLTTFLRPPLIPGARYLSQPLVLAEYGGIGFAAPDEDVASDSWGYGGLESDVNSYLASHRELQEVLASVPELAGYCYTQLTDVEQEINGLLTFGRRPKADPAAIRELNDMIQVRDSWK